ncbi:hypothetical protein [Sphingobacterium sp. SYP-B4668]|uniref:hypothetical protein n=1 Tax=Sphingobacterium sp. SYP-B4668 TaxID=2996035 RepID=UPI0022DD6557|nr:hypothetical protein [Sphingobacterium sp. SYP-B4668]
MKNSVWYHKLWRDKLNNIPVKESTDSAWTEMKDILDQHLPTIIPTNSNHPNDGGSAGGSSAASLGTKIWKVIAYLLPAAATISAITFMDPPFQKEDLRVQKKQKELRLDSTDQENSEQNPFKTPDPSRDRDTLRIAISNSEAYTRAKASSELPLITSRYFHDTLPPVPEVSKEHRSLLDTFVAFKEHRQVFNQQESENVFEAYPSESKVITSSGSLLHILLPPAPLASVGKHKIENDRQNKDKTRTKNQKIIPLQPDHTLYRRWSGINIHSYSYGMETGTNLGPQEKTLYAGIFGHLGLSDKWFISLGLNANSKQPIAGKFRHPSFFRPDSLRYSFTVNDSRKLILLDLPLKAEYKLTKLVSLNTGLTFNVPIKQSSAQTGLGPIYDIRDTLNHSTEIISALINTRANHVNIGFSSGVTLHLNKFDIKANYHWSNPYRVGNSLGSYKFENRYFRIGAGYRFR